LDVDPSGFQQLVDAIKQRLDDIESDPTTQLNHDTHLVSLLAEVVRGPLKRKGISTDQLDKLRCLDEPLEDERVLAILGGDEHKLELLLRLQFLMKRDRDVVWRAAIKRLLACAGVFSPRFSELFHSRLHDLISDIGVTPSPASSPLAFHRRVFFYSEDIQSVMVPGVLQLWTACRTNSMILGMFDGPHVKDLLPLPEDDPRVEALIQIAENSRPLDRDILPNVEWIVKSQKSVSEVRVHA